MKITKEQFKKLAKKHLIALEGYDINRTIEIFGVGRLYDEVIKIEQQINKNKAKEFLIERSEGMTSERIKEIQEQTAYPESASVMLALMQVWNECEQEQSAKNRRIENIKPEPEFKRGDILASILGEYILIFDKYTSRYTFSSLISNQDRLNNDNWSIPAYRHASAEEEEVFYKYLARMGKKWNAETLEIEKLDISEMVADLETACEYLKESIPQNYIYNASSEFEKQINAQIELQLICKAWNKFDEFEADWKNSDQYKHFPSFKVKNGKIELLYVSFAIRSLNPYTLNFSFKSEERARQFGNQFIDLFKAALGF